MAQRKVVRERLAVQDPPLVLANEFLQLGIVLKKPSVLLGHVRPSAKRLVK
jgi:hypothetical protein